MARTVRFSSFPHRRTKDCGCPDSFLPADATVGSFEFVHATYRVDYPIPVLGISDAALKTIKNLTAMYNTTTLVASVKADSVSSWRQVLTAPAWWFFSIFVSLTSCLLSAFAFVRLRAFYLHIGKFEFGVPQIVLLLEFTGGISTLFVQDPPETLDC
jgi:hypothetical protein